MAAAIMKIGGLMEDVWFFRDGERRAVETNATNAFDFLWAASLDLAVMAANLETAEEQQCEMEAWAPLVHKLAARLRRRGCRASQGILRVGCPSLSSEHLCRSGALQ